MIINSSSYTSAIPVALSDTINIPGPVVRTSGNTTSVSADKLVDTAAKFLQVVDADGNITNQGVQVGQVVYAMKPVITSPFMPTVATVVSVDSDTQLTLSANIFTTTAVQGYKIYDANQAQAKGAILNVGGTGNIFVETIDGDQVLIQDVPDGQTLSIVVKRVLVGTVASAGNPATTTTATKITALI
jgi:hypothetical protein